MAECKGTCDEHGALATNVKWVVKLMGTGFSLVLAAVIYFNVTIQENMVEMKDEIACINIAVTTKANIQENSLANFDLRMDVIEEVCCD